MISNVFNIPRYNLQYIGFFVKYMSTGSSLNKKKNYNSISIGQKRGGNE